jgi:hypothetical protein
MCERVDGDSIQCMDGLLGRGTSCSVSDGMAVRGC